jgi:hypothetical protein
MARAAQALAARELAVREGRLDTIIFLRSQNGRGQESSAFMDYGERLANGSMDAFFAGSKLEPQPQDLSYYNWTTRTAKVTESSSFKVRVTVQSPSPCACRSFTMTSLARVYLASANGSRCIVARLQNVMAQVSEHGSHGLAFKHTADHKLIVVDPQYTLVSNSELCHAKRTVLGVTTALAQHRNFAAI